MSFSTWILRSNDRKATMMAIMKQISAAFERRNNVEFKVVVAWLFIVLLMSAVGDHGLLLLALGTRSDVSRQIGSGDNDRAGRAEGPRSFLANYWKGSSNQYRLPGSYRLPLPCLFLLAVARHRSLLRIILN